MASVTFPLNPQSDAKRRHFCRLFPVFLIIRGSSPLQLWHFSLRCQTWVHRRNGLELRNEIWYGGKCDEQDTSAYL